MITKLTSFLLLSVLLVVFIHSGSFRSLLMIGHIFSPSLTFILRVRKLFITGYPLICGTDWKETRHNLRLTTANLRPLCWLVLGYIPKWLGRSFSLKCSSLDSLTSRFPVSHYCYVSCYAVLSMTILSPARFWSPLKWTSPEHFLKWTWTLRCLYSLLLLSVTPH